MKFVDRLRAFAESISDYARPDIIEEAASLIEDLESGTALLIARSKWSDSPDFCELQETYAKLEKLNGE